MASANGICNPSATSASSGIGSSPGDVSRRAYRRAPATVILAGPGRLAQLVRALPSHGRGHRFESRIAHGELRNEPNLPSQGWHYAPSRGRLRRTEMDLPVNLRQHFSHRDSAVEGVEIRYTGARQLTNIQFMIGDIWITDPGPSGTSDCTGPWESETISKDPASRE